MWNLTGPSLVLLVPWFLKGEDQQEVHWSVKDALCALVTMGYDWYHFLGIGCGGSVLYKRVLKHSNLLIVILCV